LIRPRRAARAAWTALAVAVAAVLGAPPRATVSPSATAQGEPWVLDLRRPDARLATVSVLSGGEPLEWAGFAIATGDVNADGLGDLILAAPGGTDDRPSRRGRIYVVYGRLDPPRPAANLTPRIPLPASATAPAAPATPSGADVVIDGAGDFDHFGRALAVGDVDGDGAADIVAGAPRADGPLDSRADCGEVFVIFGAAALPPRIDLSAPQPGARVAQIIGRSAGDAFGSAVPIR
jgi:hypothetical protein